MGMNEEGNSLDTLLQNMPQGLNTSIIDLPGFTSLHLHEMFSVRTEYIKNNIELSWI